MQNRSTQKAICSDKHNTKRKHRKHNTSGSKQLEPQANTKTSLDQACDDLTMSTAQKQAEAKLIQKGNQERHQKS